MEYIRQAADFVKEKPLEAETLARKALTKPLPLKLSKALFNETEPSVVEENEPSYEESALEGEWRLVLHFEKERDGMLPKRAKQLFRDNHSGNLFCEGCSYNPEVSVGLNIIEAHHRVPLSEIEKPAETKISDFIMLCPNCHRTIHKIDNCDFEKLKTLVDN